MTKKFFFLVLCFFILNIFSCTTVKNDEYGLNNSEDPEPYSSDEFTSWMKTLRRAEIIFTGSIPFTLLLSNIGYSVYQIVTTDLQDNYSIDNFTDSSAMTAEERYDILKISLSLSGIITAADLIIGLFETEKTDE